MCGISFFFCQNSSNTSKTIHCFLFIFNDKRREISIKSELMAYLKARWVLYFCHISEVHSLCCWTLNKKSQNIFIKPQTIYLSIYLSLFICIYLNLLISKYLYQTVLGCFILKYLPTCLPQSVLISTSLSLFLDIHIYSLSWWSIYQKPW